MRKGRRYDPEPKLNYKKVFGVIIAIAVTVMIIITIVNLVTRNSGDDEQTVSFFASYSNGRWGVINSLGEVVIENTHEEMVIVPNRSRAVFIVTDNIDDALGTYRSRAINENGEQIITGFDRVEAIDNFDSRNNIWHEENVLRVSRNGRYGLVNLDGEIILEYVYDEIQAIRRSNFKFCSYKRWTSRTC
ncbi:MAG: WG repeat-containing protein [Oscillospiraceae bacterium]|nr:WG repeat-containing protein [Oscillospiraceae bacterium]